MMIDENSFSKELAPARYEIRIKGHLEDRWAGWFDDMQLVLLDDGTTLLQGRLTDQASLHGVLEKIRNLNLTLVSVSRIDPS